MKQIINGKIYNTATMTLLVSRSVYHNGNYCGEDKVMKTKTGRLAFVRTSNGQDLYRRDSIEAINLSQLGEVVDHWTLNDEEAAALAPYCEEV